jgi:hypothetical protein
VTNRPVAASRYRRAAVVFTLGLFFGNSYLASLGCPILIDP